MSKDKKKEKPKTTATAKVPAILQTVAVARMVDEETAMALPTLYECLLPQYEGSTLLRPAGKLSLSVEGVYWRVQLDLPYERLTCRMYCQSLASALSDLNRYLASGQAVFSPMYEKSKKPLPRLDAVVE